MRLCKKELPKNYTLYALRKACFRGGWTFTSARYALTIQSNVISADAVSMHHTFINGRYVPQDFKVSYPNELKSFFDDVLETSLDYVLSHYAKPFDCAFHAAVRFKNIRLKKGTCFEDWGIALESTSKFKKEVECGCEIGLDPANVMQENAVRNNGWFDQFDCADFAFGKLYSAKTVVLHLNELELWTLSRVYEWDSIEPLFGEATVRFKLPPDFVTLQSNKLYAQKDAAKTILFNYVEGQPYKGDTKYMPDGIAIALRDGTLVPQFFEQWYSSTVKGMFNGIYGTMAQDVFKPQYKCEDGSLVVDEATITTPENYEEKKPRTTRVLYTYGMRIVGGSRMHMAILMELLYKKLGNRIRVLGGDTDSVKVSCDDDVTDAEIEAAMEPLGKSAENAINYCMARLRKNFPDLASDLKGIGSFEIENKGRHYELHYELWNKARVSYANGKTHITCAGLPRPIGLYTIESFMEELIDAGFEPERVLCETVGFDRLVSSDISHTLEHHKPLPTDMFEETVTDYEGVDAHVCSHQSTALYSAPRWLGETLKLTNRLSVDYLERKYGRVVDTTTTYLERDKITGKAKLLKDTANGIKVVMQA